MDKESSKASSTRRKIWTSASSYHADTDVHSEAIALIRKDCGPEQPSIHAAISGACRLTPELSDPFSCINCTGLRLAIKSIGSGVKHQHQHIHDTFPMVSIMCIRLIAHIRMTTQIWNDCAFRDRESRVAGLDLPTLDVSGSRQSSHFSLGSSIQKMMPYQASRSERLRLVRSCATFQPGYMATTAQLPPPAPGCCN